MLKTEAIKKLLGSTSYPPALQYTFGMEVQVNVSPKNGEIINGELGGIKWKAYTDGLTTWKNFRIPWKANEEPEYTDSEIKFDISKHAEAIGMTGWDFINKKSCWVGFDFDSIHTHADGLTSEELGDIVNKLKQIPFVTLYTSKSGTGIHLYVYLDIENTTNNHTEHANLAKIVLDKIINLSGLNLNNKVDTLGSNLWVWHKQTTEKGFKCIKQGEVLKNLPIITISQEETTQQIIASQQKISIDKEHQKLLDWFEKSKVLWWWDKNKHMLVCHTWDLQIAHEELKLKGFFKTIATGKHTGKDQNCFLFPSYEGSWSIRRHTKGVTEHASWLTDSSGWTYCYFNKKPSLRNANFHKEGLEESDGYSYKTLQDAVEVLTAMGIDCIYPADCTNRTATLKISGSNIVLSFTKEDDDNVIEGWIKKTKIWQKIFSLKESFDTELPDNLVRNVMAADSNLGWFFNINNCWIRMQRQEVSLALIASHYPKKLLSILLGRCILGSWTLDLQPFKPEYPGNRIWNRNAPQLKYKPIKAQYEHWELILKHIGIDLNIITKTHSWCKKYNINSGYLYLTAWIASLFQYPEEPLPYLVFYSIPQNTGKSILHEALSLLVTNGIVRADEALVNSQGFNGELAQAVVGIIEETDLSKGRSSADRIKDWVTGKTILIHPKKETPYDSPNRLHWMQFTNDPNYCPIFPGDTRIVLIEVPTIRKEIPKPILLKKLEEEASGFLYYILNFKVPPSDGRLRIPVLTTESKQSQEEINISPIVTFCTENTYLISGEVIDFTEFCNRFKMWLGTDEVYWTNRKIGKELLRNGMLKGKYGSDSQMHLGNRSFEPEHKARTRLRLVNGRLVT